MLQYWQEQLKGKTEPLALPYDKARPLVRSTNGASIEFTLSDTLSGDLRQLCNKKNTTLFSLLLAGFQTLLHKYTSQNDILVGTPFAARVAGDFADTVGYFVNSVVISTSFTGTETFNDILLQTKQKVNKAIEFQDYPFSLLVNKLESERDPSRTPIFQAMFDLTQPREDNEMSELFANRNAGKNVKTESSTTTKTKGTKVRSE
jgi:non-ribosomal peptide synthetase component F